MAPQYALPTRLSDYIAFLLPWAHGHQLKAIGDFVAAIIEQQTACQAQLARYFGNQEAAGKRLARLLHNERLDPRLLADAVLLQALHQLPKHGKVRLAIDWTIEADQHLLVVSLVMGRRAVPIYWRAYDTSVLKGRMKRYELAVIRRAVGRVAQAVAHAASSSRPIGVLRTWPCLPYSASWASRSSSGCKPAPTSRSRASGASWGNCDFGAMSVTAVLALYLTVRVVHNAYGCRRVAPETPRATGAFGIG